MMKKKPATPTKDVPLVPFGQFKIGVARIISNTKKKSDNQLAELKAANLKRREKNKS